MEPTPPSPDARLLKTVIGVAIAIAVLGLTEDTQPPVGWATGGYEVTCNQAPAWGGAAIILIFGGLVAWWVRQSSRNRTRVR